MPWHERWRNVFRSDRIGQELDDELEFHLAETVDRLMEEGMSEEEARHQARVRLGNYGLQKERTREMNIAVWLETTWADLKYALRQLRSSPAFTFVAVMSLALGIGANTAMFQLVDAIRLRMLPVKNPQELVEIQFAKGSTRSGWWSSRSAQFTYGQFDELRKRQEAFQGIMAWSVARFNLSLGGESRFAEGLFVSGNFFEQLGVPAALGRTLSESDDTASCNAGAVLSDAFWRREYGADPNILGKTVSLDGYQLPIIGVTGPAFFGVEVGAQYNIAIPLCADRVLKKGRIGAPAGWWLSLLGRLKPGVTTTNADAHLRTISPAIMSATIPPAYRPDTVKRYTANILVVESAGTGISGLRKSYERPLWLLMATTALVLLIACANLANLLLARASAREPEIAVRLAIGASRWRLVHQLLVESLLLALTGAILGAALAVTLSKALVAFISTTSDPVFVDMPADWRVLGYAAGLAVITCVLFGLLPALRSTVLSPASAMRAGGRSVTAGAERFNLRRALVVTQVALSLVLLVGALLFARSLNNLMTTEMGFRAEGILTMSLDLSKAPFPEERRREVYREIKEQLAALPQVIAVADVSSTPVSGNSWDSSIGPDGAPASGSGKDAFFNRAGPGYFKAMGTRLLAGREFDSRDTLDSPKVAIVNELFARKYYNGANPVGRTFNVGASAGEKEELFQVVGMIENMKYHQIKEDFKPIVFLAKTQERKPGADNLYVIRVAAASPDAIRGGAKSIVQNVSSTIGIEFRPFAVQLRDSVLRERLMATLSGGFGFLAGLLATMGLYGVISYMVARRQREIGVRIALGADRGQVLRLVLKEAVILLAAGVTVGSVLALWAGTTAASLLFGLQPYDVTTLLSAIGLLAAVTLLAGYIPAQRASTLDPISTLRNE